MVSVRSDSWTQGEFKRGAASETLRVNTWLVTKEAEQKEKMERIGCGYFVLLRYGEEFVLELYHIETWVVHIYCLGKTLSV